MPAITLTAELRPLPMAETGNLKPDNVAV